MILTEHIQTHVDGDRIAHSIVGGALIDARLLAFQLLQGQNGSVADAGRGLVCSALRGKDEKDDIVTLCKQSLEQIESSADILLLLKMKSARVQVANVKRQMLLASEKVRKRNETKQNPKIKTSLSPEWQKLAWNSRGAGEEASGTEVEKSSCTNIGCGACKTGCKHRHRTELSVSGSLSLRSLKGPKRALQPVRQRALWLAGCERLFFAKRTKPIVDCGPSDAQGEHVSTCAPKDRSPTSENTTEAPGQQIEMAWKVVTLKVGSVLAEATHRGRANKSNGNVKCAKVQ